MKKRGQYRVAQSPRRSHLWNRNRHPSYFVGAVSLDDLVAASRIVEAQKKGFVPQVKTGSMKATIVAARVSGHRKGKGRVQGIPEKKLNRMIVGRNSRLNIPTDEARIKYLKMMEEE